MAHSCVLVLVSVALLLAMAGATQFRVGGSNGWSVPDPSGVSLIQWAAKNRFKMGDSLLFVYPPGKDSVLQVDNEGYASCNTGKYIDKFDDGYTVFTFNNSGPFYFISGVDANCIKNESLIVVVMGDRANRSESSPPPSPSAAPPPSPPPPPPPPPAPEASEPSPPPPPPPESSEAAAAPPPAAEPTPAGEAPSGAASRVVGLVGMAGPLLGGALLVL